MRIDVNGSRLYFDIEGVGYAIDIIAELRRWCCCPECSAGRVAYVRRECGAD